MLTTTMKSDEKARKSLIELIGNDQGWPLPNLKLSAEHIFWHSASVWGFGNITNVGPTEIEPSVWASVILFSGGPELAGGGYAIAHIYSAPRVNPEFRTDQVRYYTWGKCHHQWKSYNTGRCLTTYRCDKCGASYDIDSSD